MDTGTNRFDPIIETIRRAPRLEPPEGLSRRVMRHIMPANHASCAPYFFMAALFFLVLGSTLFAGLKQGPTWIMMQPLLALLCGALFAILGMILKTDSRFAPRIIRLGITCYSLLILGNTLAISPMTTSATLGIVLTIALSAACVLMGQILARAVFSHDLTDTNDKATP